MRQIMDKEKIKRDMLALASIGQDESGGINRVFGSGYMKTATNAVSEYMSEAGMDVRVDSVGNVHGIYAPNGTKGKEILIGSHLDTVPGGGVYDGLLGIVGAVETVRMLRYDNINLSSPIHVIATNGEEGNDLGGTFGSRAMMGLLDTEDPNYLSCAESFGYTKEDLEAAIFSPYNCACYLELHIEQGKTLYENHESIGIVTGIVGLQRYEISIVGEANHAGTTMMEYRRDALVAAAGLIIEADRMARDYGRQMVATIGKLNLYPNSVAVIPGSVTMILEIRNQEESVMEEFISEFEQRAAIIAPNVSISFSTVVKKAPVHCDKKIISTIENACREKNVSCRLMPSGATHDGNAMATKLPIGMIFVPSVDGISHDRHEKTEWEDVMCGIDILYNTVKELAEDR